MNFDFAHYMLTGGKTENETNGSCSPSNLLYRRHLAETLNMDRTRILAFKSKTPQPKRNIHEAFPSPWKTKYIKAKRHVPQSAERTLDAPDVVDDFYLNLLDWSSWNVVAVALGNSVHLWDASNGSTSELISTGDDVGPVTSVKWAPDGRHIAVGLNNSHVQLWDSSTSRLLRTLHGHSLRVSSLDWNNHILTTGGMDGTIINNDVRIRSHNIGTYRGHREEVCGLQWCSSGQHLASGGNDSVVFIWSVTNASTNSHSQWSHRFEDHSGAVKALAWCPFQSNLLASGGGVGDQTIKFWNTTTGACLNSVNTASQVCSLLWSTHERELLSAHGYNENQLILWKYPSMVKISELHGHTSRILNMAKSPDGNTVASIASDETLRFWNVFGDPQQEKRKAEKIKEPFPNVPRIR